MTYTPPETRSASNNITLNIKRTSPHSTSNPIHSTSATKSPHSNTTAPKQTFNPDGTRKYLNIRPAGGQPFPLKKGKRYLAEDHKDGIKMKEKGATSSAKERKAKSERAAGSVSGMKDEERGIKQEAVSVSRQHSSQDSDSSPERPLIEVLRSMRRGGEKVEGSASGQVGMNGGATEESEDERGRKMVRDAGKRGGGTRGGK
ncbi:hypothetical protein JMJ35_004031 [Cladonia borealis]|uniref:Uncharacterized protein n=1 Tax=Cladonia borealis TaxID=184061 RepID=A0AA39R2E2_9LECA|nr:hypothetical protein JMJ35_004031 [Cladonia borealis]